MPNLIEDRISIVSKLIAEVIEEAREFDKSQDSTITPNSGNRAWLTLRSQARNELIEHLKRTFGGLE